MHDHPPAMHGEQSGEHTFEFVGGMLCLDFINTVDGRLDAAGPDKDYLAGYADLVAWGRQAGLYGEGAAAALGAKAEAAPRQAAAVLDRAHRLRNALYGVLAASLAGRPTKPTDLKAINAEVAALGKESRLVPDGPAFALVPPAEQRDDDPPLDRPLWPVVRSIVALLTTAGDLSRVHECAADSCGWLFFDPSGRRRWCSMADCGNAEKVRRFRARRRAGAA